MRGPFWSKKVMKKKKKETQELLSGQPVVDPSSEAYAEYVAIKKAEHKAEMKKEKMAEKVIQPRVGAILNNDFITTGGLRAASNGFPSDIGYPTSDEIEEVPYQGQPEGVKALKGILPKAKKKTYTGRGNAAPAKSSLGYYYGDQAPAQAQYIDPSAKVEVEDDGSILPEIESADAKLPSDVEVFSQIREDLRIYRTSDRTIVSAVVVDKDETKNKTVAIRCFGGSAFGGYVRDCSGDAYLIEGIDYVGLGTIPFSFRLEVPNAGNWSVNIPISEKVLMSSFAPSQLKAISDLRERYPEDKYNINFLQMLLAN
jgi:hypothetical protein